MRSNFSKRIKSQDRKFSGEAKNRYLRKGHPGGKRCVGRPRKKWIEDVIEDLEEMGVRMWRRKAQDRETWARIVKQVLDLNGP
ncbi:hypothetical protein C0J52_23292 [Blattella germanica]|nr:hypothetical protein C0J52_23292 [Blattella germanica]